MVVNLAAAKQVHIANVLKEKYGVVGVIAGRYVTAGCSVELYHSTRLGQIQVLARRGNEVYAIEVYTEENVPLDKVKSFHEKAKLVKAKPIVVLYGKAAGLSEEAYKYCLENDVRIRRVQAL